MGSIPKPHMVLFPFMSKGHTIPLLHLAHHLLQRGVTITLFTTKANRPFILQFFHRHPNSDSISIIDLPFPATHVEGVGIPQGIESTDNLPSMSLFLPFTTATKLMQPHFEQALSNLSNVNCIISDMFLSWTLESANKFGILRFTFYGFNAYSTAVSRQVMVHRLLSGPEPDDELITVPRFPWIKVCRNDFNEPINEREPAGPHFDFVIESEIATANSHGMIMNSFYELEPQFVDFLNTERKPKVWCVGPLCLAEPPPREVQNKKPKWIDWLDQKLAQGCPVLYVAFGSQTEISTAQLEAISTGLKESGVNFLWVVRKLDASVFDDLQERVGERGMMVREWVNQREILNHKIVKGFLSHCGLNSILESICSKVPILAWPMIAEQPLNARMVAEELKVGLRVKTSDDGSGFVKAEGLKKMVTELMEGEKGEEVRKKIKEVGEGAMVAMAEGGSSWQTLNELIDEVQTVRVKHNFSS